MIYHFPLYNVAKVKKIESIDNKTGEIVVKSNRHGYGDEENE